MTRMVTAAKERGGPSPDPEEADSAKAQTAVFHGSVDWVGRHHPPVRRFLNWLERLSLALEEPINKIVGQAQYNPLYHTGTITVFLLLVILFTGIYLTMFYQFGFTSSYEAVAAIEASFVGRLVRAVHRYASGTAVITTILHGWRTFFQDRFRGARWLAWVSGIIMAAFIWIVGITGYWLIWDERTQILNQTLIRLFQNSALGQSFLINYLVTEAAGTGWIFILLVLTVHLLLSLIIGLFFWYLHVKRLNRPKILPPRYWMWVSTGLLVVAGIILPVGMLPAADPGQLPGPVSIDSFFLFYLPAALNWPPALIWGGALILLALVSAIPWLLVRKPLPPIVVSEERCTGCTLCAADCPYNAIEMVERTDGRSHKYIAVVDPKMCVACGVCIGSCPPLALTLGEQPAEPLWQTAVARAANDNHLPTKVIFTCERHILQGARPILNSTEDGRSILDGMHIQVVPLTCIGMAHPDLAAQALDAGATAVQFVGCPPEDCANREGNVWLEQRLSRERLPKLKKQFIDAPITTHWLPPNQFIQGLRVQSHQALATTYDFVFQRNHLRAFIPALILLAIVLAIQIWLSDLPFTAVAAEQARIDITLEHQSGNPLRGVASTSDPVPMPGEPVRLQVEVDDTPILDETYESLGGKRQAVPVYEQIDLAPGTYHLRLTLFDRPDPVSGQIIFDNVVVLDKGQVLPLNFVDTRVGPDATAGEDLYYETSLGTNAACRICHSLQPGVDLVGPSFVGIASRAGDRVPGLTAEEYLYQSITNPDAYIVEGYPAGQMVPNLAEILTEEQIDDLIAFLMTLE
jgi:ferredoxin/coenzyme F420-reducing hydrogenase delta subunit/cytochrome c551/c552